MNRRRVALLSAFLLTSCIALPVEDGAPKVTHRNAPSAASERIAQFSFGSAAHFARCKPGACPSITPKTVAVVQIQEPLALIAPQPPRPSVDETEPDTAKSPAPVPVKEPERNPPAPSSQREERVVVEFSVGKAELNAEAKRALRKALPLARAAERIVINGRTDSVGSEEVNQALALARALAVREFIRTSQPDLPQLIAISARGNCCFIADNDSAQGRQKNRRVEVVFNVSQQRT